MTTITKIMPVLDIQDIPNPDRRTVFDLLNALGWIRANDAAYVKDFGDFFYEDDYGRPVKNTEDYDPEYFQLYDILVKYVPAEILKKPFIFKVWW